MEPWIETRTGRRIDLRYPHESDICLDDVAHALGHICRYTGHSSIYYSVAEHCVRASMLVPTDAALATLLHDAHEAYVGDVSSPLKSLVPDYRRIEDEMERVVFTALMGRLPNEYEARHIKQADVAMLRMEAEAMMDSQGREWPILQGVAIGYDFVAPGWGPEVARWRWKDRFLELTRKDGWK